MNLTGDEENFYSQSRLVVIVGVQYRRNSLPAFPGIKIWPGARRQHMAAASEIFSSPVQQRLSPISLSVFILSPDLSFKDRAIRMRDRQATKIIHLLSTFDTAE